MFDWLVRDNKSSKPNTLNAATKEKKETVTAKKEVQENYPAREHAAGNYDPATGTYTIKGGDTQYSVALRFKISTDALIKLNGDAAKHMAAGTQLKIKPGPHIEDKKKTTPAVHKHADTTTETEKKPYDIFSIMHGSHDLNPFSVWDKLMHPEPEISKPLKDWMDKTVTGKTVFEKNKGYADLLFEAEKLKLIHIEDGKVRATFNKILEGENIGNGQSQLEDVNRFFDPTANEVYILPLIVTMIKSLIKTYGDKVYEHKFELGSFMIWADNDPAKGRYKDELRTTQHGLGRAVDIHGIEKLGTRKFQSAASVDFVMTMLKQLPPGNYQVGLPQQGDFFPLALDAGNSASGNEVYKKLKSEKLVDLIKSLKESGRNLIVFPDADNHLHIGVLP